MAACRALPVVSLRRKMCYNARDAMTFYSHPSFKPAAKHLIGRGWEAVRALETLATMDEAVWIAMLRKPEAHTYIPTPRSQALVDTLGRNASNRPAEHELKE